MRFLIQQVFLLVCVLLFTGDLKAQGTVLVQNNIGTIITYLSDASGGQIRGSDYSIQLHLFDPSKVHGLGNPVGPVAILGANGRFSAGVVEIPDSKPGESVPVVFRWWRQNSDPVESSSTYPIYTPPLGGDPDGNGPILPIPPTGVLSGSLVLFSSQLPLLTDARYAPWIYTSDNPGGNFRLLAPAFYNAFGSSLRFVPGPNDRFFRLVSATNAPILVNIGPAPSLFGLEPPPSGWLRILFQ